jgi:hypothetical protein
MLIREALQRGQLTGSERFVDEIDRKLGVRVERRGQGRPAKCKNKSVPFSVLLTLDPLEFIRRFLQHVLPKGFMKVRYYGFLSPTTKVPLEDLKALVELAHGFTVTVPEIELPSWPQPICRACGGRLRFHSAVRTPRSTRPLPMSAGPPGSTALAANG